MAHAFVVRPFGVRLFKDKNGNERKIDFTEVHKRLIAPAMQLAGIKGNTTENITSAGNIRVDMFQLLALADIVIADISVHNANVFYELGARHALRDKRTFLIRFSGDEVPFDLKTDRYLEYDLKDLAASVPPLAEGLSATLRESKVDSPIFGLLPELKPPAVRHLMPVPEKFAEELHRAEENKRVGHLLLLAQEAQQLQWGAEGMRLVGRVLFALKAWQGALDTWEGVLELLDQDLEADLKLGTVNQRCKDMAKSDIAVQRAIRNPEITPNQLAEALSLLASNTKQRWMDNWGSLASTQLRRSKALQSPHLRDALQSYSAGFNADLNHFYSGVNALALNRVLVELARQMPDEWKHAFADDDEASRELKKHESQLRDLEGAVSLAVKREWERVKKNPDARRWADISAADVLLLRVETPARVAAAYHRALENAAAFYFDSVRRQLALYTQLGLFDDILQAVLKTLEELEPLPEKEKKPKHVLLFSGHRVDAPGRKAPRFPADREEDAKAEIRKRIKQEIDRVGDAEFIGMAGGASGGDILFHEICKELGISSELFLAIPSADYINASVRVDGKPEWIDRFRAIEKRCKTWQLADSATLPEWLGAVKDYDIWERNNRWNLYSALARGAANVSVIVLWDGKPGDGPGGTMHMVEVASNAGAKVIHIDTVKLFGLSISQVAASDTLSTHGG